MDSIRLRVGRCVGLFTIALGACASPSNAQTCNPAWLPAGADGGVPGTDMGVLATRVFDPDGPGSEPAWLVVGGSSFTGVTNAAGTTSIRGIAGWNGSTWASLGEVAATFQVPTIRVLHVHDGELIAGGNFSSIEGVALNNVAAWNGTTWRPLGAGLGSSVTTSEVRALATYQGELVAGGEFVVTGAGALVNNLARFDGTEWRSVATGVVNAGATTSVNALLNFGSELVVAGRFSNAGSIPARNIARWNGTSFLPQAQGVGRSANEWVLAAVVTDSGLLAGGNFLGLPGESGSSFQGVARWTGTQWVRPVPGYNFPAINSIQPWNGEVYLSSDVNSQSQLLRWGGGSSPPTPVLPTDPPSATSLRRLDVYGGQLIIAGDIPFTAAGLYAGMGVVTFDGAAFAPLNRGFAGSVASVVPDGDGALFLGSIGVAGNALIGGAGGNSVGGGGLVRWDGLGTWQGFGSYPPPNTVLDAGRYGGSIIVGGMFSTSGGPSFLARWNGASWEQVGGVSPNSQVRAVAVFESELYIAGGFGNVGGVTTTNIARWNGTQWRPVASGLSGPVNDLEVFGNRLVATGTFANAGAIQVNRVAAWDGSAWQPLGSGLGTAATGVTLASLGGELFAAGTSFSSPLTPVARWVNGQWVPMLASPATVSKLAVVEGSLYAVGSFNVINNVACAGLARWNGVTWVVPSVGAQGTFSPGTSFGTFPSGIAPLTGQRGLVVGNFIAAGGNVARGWATFTPGGGQNPIVAQPDDFVACPGLTAQFNVVLQQPAEAVYEWRRDSMTLRNGRGVSGAMSSVLTIDNVVAEDIGQYQCRITTACGVILTRAATLNVVAQPTCPKVCDDIDFNNDGSLFDPLDIDSFLSVFSEGPCL